MSRQRLRWEILDAFASAAEQAGIARIEDFNRGDNAGVSYFDVNQRNGLRLSAARAFLKPVRARANLTVWLRTQAERLRFDQHEGRLRCSGATLLRGGERLEVRAAREVILSAGAIATPQLLQLSGVGPAELLREHGIAPVHELAGVGANLQDHLQIRPVFKVQGVRTLNVVASSLWGRLGIGLEYALRRTGPMSMAPSQLGAFVKSDPGRAHANLQYHVQPLSLRAYDQPIDSFPAFTASVCNLNPTSRGSVRIRNRDVHSAPRIAPNYLATEEDRRVAADSLRVTRRIVAQPALARYAPEEYLPGARFTSDADLLREGGNIATTIFHPVGTARMGTARRSRRGGGQPPACARCRRFARGRRQHHAHYHQRQYQQPDADDRGKSRALDCQRHLIPIQSAFLRGRTSMHMGIHRAARAAGLACAWIFFGTAALAADADWKPLFNGKNLNGWSTHYASKTPADAPAPSTIFKVEEGAIHVYPTQPAGSEQPNAYLETDADYKDYVLSLEYRWGEKKFAPRLNLVRDAGLLYHVHRTRPADWPGVRRGADPGRRRG